MVSLLCFGCLFVIKKAENACSTGRIRLLTNCWSRVHGSMDDQILIHLQNLATVLEREKDPYRMMDQAVAKLMDFFGADGGWLLYPCDLDSPSCHIKFASTREGFRDTFSDHYRLPFKGELATCLGELFESEKPLVRVAADDQFLFEEVLGSCGVKSQLAMVVRMNKVRPWVIGLHQCSSARVWSPSEVDFFHYAVDRIRDGFNAKFYLRENDKSQGKLKNKKGGFVWSEKRFRSFFNISNISLCLGDFSTLGSFFDKLRKSGVTELNGALKDHFADLKKMLSIFRDFEMNRATLDLFEASDKQQLSFTIHKCFTRETLFELVKILEALYAGEGHITVEVPFKTLKGKFIDTILSVDVLSGMEPDEILVSITDISVQKESERKLMASIEQYRQLLETAHDAIFLIDTESGKILDANQKAAELLGRPVVEIIGQHRTVLHAPEDWRHYREIFETQFEHEVSVSHCETAVLNADGYKVPVEISASRSAIYGRSVILGIFHDIGGRLKNAERQNLLVTAIEKIDESVVITDPLGNIEYVNSAFENLSGYSSDEALGGKPNLLRSGVHEDGHYLHLWQTISNGDVWRGQFVNRKKDGTLYQEDVTITPVLDSKGRVQHYVAVKRDITKQVATEEQQRQSQKMQAIGTLSGGIAHDFNNILTPIMGFAEMSILLVDGNEALRANLLEIVNAADRAGKLIDQILSFSKQTEKKTASLGARAIVEEVLVFLRASLPACIEIVQEMDSDAKVRVDPTQLHQVIMNLCTNAYQALCDEGGVIKVSLRSVTLGKRQGVEIGKLSHRKYIRLRVEDNGRGIPKEYVNRIFDPYFTTRDINEGHGFGLSVVYGIVNEYGGAVIVNSEPGQGSCFDVYLPEVDSS